MNGFETIIFEKKGPVAYITLNRPQVLNVYNVQMRDDLFEAVSTVKEDRDIRVLIVKGAGEKAFCAGADLQDFLLAPTPTTARYVRWQRDVWGVFLSLPQPAIAAVHGYCFGSGIEIAMCCDIRIAADNIVFGLPEVSLGIIPAAGATQTVPRVIGAGRTLEMFLTSRRIGADEALQMNLANRVVPRDQLLPEAEALAQKIAGFDRRAVGAIKKAVTRGIELPLDEGLKIEQRIRARYRSR